MNRTFRIVIVLMLIVCLWGTARIQDRVDGLSVSGDEIVRWAQTNQVEMIEQSMKSVVAVYHPSVGVPASGFYIGNGIIVTAGHVAEMDGIEKVVFEDGDEYSVLEQIVHPDYDCGFLLIKYPCDPIYINEPSLKFDTEKLKRGDVTFVLGNPNGLLFMAYKGMVSGVGDCNGYFGKVTLIIVDDSAKQGNSGSVLVDGEGEVRGVHVGSHRTRCGSGLMGSGLNIGTQDILKALEAAGLETEQ